MTDEQCAKLIGAIESAGHDIVFALILLAVLVSSCMQCAGQH